MKLLLFFSSLYWWYKLSLLLSSATDCFLKSVSDFIFLSFFSFFLFHSTSSFIVLQQCLLKQNWGNWIAMEDGNGTIACLPLNSTVPEPKPSNEDMKWNGKCWDGENYFFFAPFKLESEKVFSSFLNRFDVTWERERERKNAGTYKYLWKSKCFLLLRQSRLGY